MKLLKIAFLSFLIFLCNQGKTQTLQIDDVQACVGDTASISINMSAIDSVGAITLYIGYDTTKLNFIDSANVNPLATGILINVGNARLGKIVISWTANGGAGVNFNAGIFVVFKFKVLTRNCPIVFLTDCEIANYNAQIINTTYINGSLTIVGLSEENNNSTASKIFPNPFSEYISIDFQNTTFVEEINIFQIDGKLHKQIIKKEQITHLSITQLNELEKGIYFIEIISKNKEGIKERKINKLTKN